MRKSLLSLFFILPFLALNAQKIDESKIDAFTGKPVIYTTWTKFYDGEGPAAQMSSEVRFRYEHERHFMQIKIITGSVVLTSKEGARIDFKTDKGVFTFANLRTETAGRGRGLQGGRSEQLGMTLQVTGDFNVLRDAKVEKIRYHFVEGYYDIEVPVKYQKVFANSFELILNEIKTVRK